MPSTLSDLELLRRLVAFDSVSARGTREIADFVSAYLDRPDIRSETVRDDNDEQVNIIAWRGDLRPDRRGLVLSGHLDVVPARRDHWNTDPFELIAHGDNLYGRGTSDMKGFIALAMNLLVEAEDRSELPLMLMFSAEEEVGALGAKVLAESWPVDELPPRATLIGEPTTLDVIAMHKGHLKVRIHVVGASAHSGTPHFGANAIERATVIISALGVLRDALHAETGPYAEAFGEAPFPALNIGRVHGGTAINVVPDACTIELGVRPLPG
ncbi:MAG: M20/M25/M40 family metallo-hydrolase, partial [Phycisphaerales bacterium]|nr:M20/M25/M40 family metallo-hydrolase [Phycisphaerales bacterium]